MAEWIEILNCFNFGTMILSPLAMAEWIEMTVFVMIGNALSKSPLAMAEWIEIFLGKALFFLDPLSPLAMAEWIEIFLGRFPT